jgi:hypothetical protein
MSKDNDETPPAGPLAARTLTDEELVQATGAAWQWRGGWEWRDDGHAYPGYYEDRYQYYYD